MTILIEDVEDFVKETSPAAFRIFVAVIVVVSITALAFFGLNGRAVAGLYWQSYLENTCAPHMGQMNLDRLNVGYNYPMHMCGV